ncbi:MAG: hypothetical protein LBG81_05765 [Coriobacteriaceae bacterium]|nr:hypothetical protein [Coriobacteriaceae bacterium]
MENFVENPVENSTVRTGSLRGVDGSPIRRGDWVLNVNSDKAYVVEHVDGGGMMLSGGRYVPWFIADSAWRLLGYRELVRRREARSARAALDKDPRDPRHGLDGYGYGCRCAVCVDAELARWRHDAARDGHAAALGAGASR